MIKKPLKLEKLNYDLRASQVETPRNVVKFFWEIVHKHATRLGTVLDMGAGDGKFSQFGTFGSYTGIEIDPTRITNKRPRKNAAVKQGCVFAQPSATFDACIGNPPYLRHQDIESPWKEETLHTLSEGLGVPLSGHSNLFLYFMALSLIRSSADGLAALIVPFDWVSRPAARGLRSFIKSNKWNVTVYRFSFPVFVGVDTTASISIVNKRIRKGVWKYFDVDKEFRVRKRSGVTGTGEDILNYVRRTNLYARRGMSPGTQEVFTLTEGERLHHGLAREDVVPCVTTLRGLDSSFDVLDRTTFETQLVKAGRRCWLIKSRNPRMSPRLQQYLDSIPTEARNTATCRKQTPWYRYEEVKVPQLLLHSGFTSSPPRVVINSIRAVPVGSMYGIYGCPKGQELAVKKLVDRESVASKVVPHSGHLRKIEVGQLNSILSSLAGAHHG